MLASQQQKEAINAAINPIAVIAGPGSGKTYTLVQRINHLVDNKLFLPNEILAITFTNKSAKELSGRINSDKVNVSTFHALGLKIIKEFSNLKTIVDKATKNSILRDLPTKKFGSLKELELYISVKKSQGENDEIVNLYQNILNQKNLIDFDDLILDALSLIDNNKDLSKRLGNRYKYILVDEFQDTNLAQYKLLKLILKDTNNIFVIGDPKQSIYSFRGADATIIKKFIKEFDARKIKLDKNFRSSKKIIQLSNKIFSDKQIHPGSKEGTIHYIETLNEFSEASFIAKKISQLVGGLDMIQSSNMSSNTDESMMIDTSDFSDIAILYRNHHINKQISKRLSKEGIPFQIIGEKTVFEKDTSQFVFNLIKQLNKKDRQVFQKLLNYKILDLSTSQVELILKNYSKQDTLTYIKDLISQKNLNRTKGIDKLLTILSSNTLRDLLTHLDNNKIEEEQIENLKIIFYTFLDKNLDEIKHKAMEVIDQLEENNYYSPKMNNVTLMSIHASKGLEFKTVFIAGFEEGLIPGQGQDERQLFFVAVTRAKDLLILTRGQNRYKTAIKPSQYEHIVEGVVKKQIDPDIQKRKRKIHQNKQKKSQMKLF